MYMIWETDDWEHSGEEEEEEEDLFVFNDTIEGPRAPLFTGGASTASRMPSVAPKGSLSKNNFARISLNFPFVLWPFSTSYSIRDHQYILTNGDYRNPSKKKRSKMTPPRFSDPTAYSNKRRLQKSVKKEAVKNDPPPVLGPYSIF